MPRLATLLFCFFLLFPVLIWSQTPPPDAFITRYDITVNPPQNSRSYSTITRNDKVVSLIPGVASGNFTSDINLFLHDHLGNFEAAKQLQFPDPVSLDFTYNSGNGILLGGRKINDLAPVQGDSLDALYLALFNADTVLTRQAEIRFSNGSVEAAGTPFLSDSGNYFIPLTVFRNDVAVSNEWQVLLSLTDTLTIDTALFLNPSLEPGITVPATDSSLYWWDRDKIIHFNDTLLAEQTWRCAGPNCFERLLAVIPLPQQRWLLAGTPFNRPDTAVALKVLDADFRTFRNLGLAQGRFGNLTLTRGGDIVLATSTNNNPCFFKVDTALLQITDTVRIRDVQLELSSVSASGICGGKFLMAAVDINLNQPVFSKLDTGLQSFCADTAAVVTTFNNGLRYNPAFASNIQPGIAYSLPYSIQEQVLNPNPTEFCSNRNCNLVSLPPEVLVCAASSFRIAPTLFRDPCAEEQPARTYDWNANNLGQAFINVTETGRYTVSANEAGCPTDVETIEVTFDTVFIDLQSPRIICTNDNDSTTLALNPRDSITDILWSTEDTTLSITVGDIDTYSVSGVTPLGCRRTATAEVTEFCAPEVWVPNAFTPNGDGTNDFFLPVTVFVEDYDFRIYNRWGQEVFFSDTPGEAWNGKGPKGTDSPVGIYVWRLEIDNSFNSQINKRIEVGHVALVR